MPIVGYVGPRQCVDLIVDGLRKLEYRGYDSAGVAVVGPGGLAIKRAKGKLQNLCALLAEAPLTGCTGIAHTRWATHGEPHGINAHPHTDCTLAASRSCTTGSSRRTRSSRAR